MWRWIGVPACRLRIESNFRTACQAFSQADHPPDATRGSARYGVEQQGFKNQTLLYLLTHDALRGTRRQAR
jgi:hypothetical protein